MNANLSHICDADIETYYNDLGIQIPEECSEKSEWIVLMGKLEDKTGTRVSKWTSDLLSLCACAGCPGRTNASYDPIFRCNNYSISIANKPIVEAMMGGETK